MRYVIEFIIFLSLMAFFYPAFSQDFYEDFDAYRYEEQRRFEIEIEREDRRESLERREEERERWGDIWEDAHGDNEIR